MIFHRLTLYSLLALILLGIAWEWRLAPLYAGGSWLILKVIPLALALPGVVRGKRYTCQWLSMLVLLYVAEAAVRFWSENGTVRHLALLEFFLALACFCGAVGYVRYLRNYPSNTAQTPAREH